MPFLEEDPGPLDKSWTCGPTESPLKGERRETSPFLSVNQEPEKTGLRLPGIGRRRGTHLTVAGIYTEIHVGGGRVPRSVSFVSWGSHTALW